MSLILEALRKLDREKGEPRGFLVLSGEAPRRGSRGLWALGIVLGGALLAFASFRLLPSAPRIPPPSPEAPPRAVAQPGTPSPTPPPETLLLEDRHPSPLPRTIPLDRPVPVMRPSPPPSAPSPSPETFVLEAISAQNGEPVAVVNGHLVREGETLEGGARVVKIGSDSVELEIKGARRVVRF